jgi:periplasmic divalent cation tolerance protein
MTNAAAMIMTTVGNREDADKLAGALISTRAAACVQELSIHSHYRWEGKVNSDPEILLLVKTAHDRVDFAIETIKANHSYTVPEILVVPVARGLDAYLQWVNDETRTDGA